MTNTALQLNTNSDENGFMAFWKILNDFAKSHDLPEVLYGEARDWFAEFKSLRQ
jgi:hypothetical protein